MGNREKGKGAPDKKAERLLQRIRWWERKTTARNDAGMVTEGRTGLPAGIDPDFDDLDDAGHFTYHL